MTRAVAVSGGSRQCANVSLGVVGVQLVHLSPCQRRGFLDGVLPRERGGTHPTSDEIIPVEHDQLPSVREPHLHTSAVIVYATVRDDPDRVAFGHA
jgi:hypothetical protein